MVDQVGRRLGHAPGSARRTKPTALAAEGHQLVVPAVAAAQPQEAVGKDAAFEKGVELVLHKLRQVGTGCGLSLLKEGGGALRATGRFGATSSRQRMSLMGRKRVLPRAMALRLVLLDESERTLRRTAGRGGRGRGPRGEWRAD